jgi:TPR repeat protein
MKIFLTVMALMMLLVLHAQTGNTANNTTDISGLWVGEISDGNSTWFYQINLIKSGDHIYSGIDSFRLLKKEPNVIPLIAPIPIGFAFRQSFTGNFNNGLLVFTNVQNLDNPNYLLNKEQLKWQDNSDGQLMTNGNPYTPGRKIVLKRLAAAVPMQQIQNTVGNNSIEIESILYKSAVSGPVLKYNDHGQFSITLKNNSGKDIQNIQLSAATAEADNGIVGYDQFKGVFGLAKNSSNTFTRPIITNFSVPADSVHLTMNLSFNGFTVQRKVSIPTECYYKTTNISVPVYTSPRLQAVSGYYGFGSGLFADVSKPLDLLVAGGDKMAAMWKGVFISMGYGGYKIDEEQGYMMGKTVIKTVEDKARNGDAEALFLLFYACQMGLEGEDARALSINFLEKSAVAGFKPAVYDYALQFTWHKDYAPAFKYLVKSYEMGVKKAAEVIGYMYEKGLTVPNDIDSAIAWYKKGMAFGDPDATLWFAKLLAKGYSNTPPDVNKALALSTAAAAKGCADAMIFNGTVYWDGHQGIAQNIPTAIKWFKAGADQGDRQAMLALGETYLADAPGMVKDEHSGLFWIKKAAELGSPKAMVVLAKFYNEGTLGEKNLIIARYWYNQAVINGFANADATGINAGMQSFMNFWKYADFSPSFIYVNEYGNKVADGDDGLMNGLVSGLFGAMSSYYGNQHALIDGLEFICKKNGFKIYGGTVSSSFVSTLSLKEGQTINIKSYGIISTGMFSGPANADGLGPNWPEYRFVKSIPCSAVMAAVKNSDWKFIGQHNFYTALKEGPLLFAINAIDYRNYKGYFDLVVQVPDN